MRHPRAVLIRPDGLLDEHIVDALRRGWGLDIAANDVEYAPVGFGSHHWRADGWFVTADVFRDGDAATRVDRLRAALRSARALRDAGLAFVVAPERTRSDDVVECIGADVAVALYPHVDGTVLGWRPYPSRNERLAVLDRVVAVHDATDLATASAPRTEAFDNPCRERITSVLDDLDRPWATGPLGERARALAVEWATSVAEALDHYDRLAAHVGERASRLRLTHGEPHPGNVIFTANDGVVLIDWDTALLAPPERDLWMLVDEDERIVDDYETRTGVHVDDRALELYRLRWSLEEVDEYLWCFHEAHEDSEETQIAWNGLGHYLSRLAR